jgi:hypothetical protein
MLWYGKDQKDIEECKKDALNISKSKGFNQEQSDITKAMCYCFRDQAHEAFVNGTTGCVDKSGKCEYHRDERKDQQDMIWGDTVQLVNQWCSK